MPNSRAAAAVDPGRRLHTATISTFSIAFRPGICRDRVLAPAPIKPMRSEWVDMVHLNRDTMSIMATNQDAARSLRVQSSDVLSQKWPFRIKGVGNSVDLYVRVCKTRRR